MNKTMNITILGTGSVGQILAGKLTAQGHEVTIGTRDPQATLAKTQPDGMGNAPYRDWAAQNPSVRLLPYAAAAVGADLLINATSGYGSLEALEAAGGAKLGDKVLIDIANPLDFSKGFPPSLWVSNTDSLGELIQKAFPRLKVVKTLNIVSAPVMINPSAVPGGQPTMFVSGNDTAAKAEVTGFLKDNFGWNDVIDLGDITTARGTEMLLPIWVRTFGVLQTPMFGFKVVR